MCYFPYHKTPMLSSDWILFPVAILPVSQQNPLGAIKDLIVHVPLKSPFWRPPKCGLWGASKFPKYCYYETSFIIILACSTTSVEFMLMVVASWEGKWAEVFWGWLQCSFAYIRLPVILTIRIWILHRFTYKVTVEVKDATRTVLECFSGSKSKKKAAAEHAAEGALWYLQHLGHKI